MVTQGGIDILLELLAQGRELEQHCLRWVVEAVRHACHADAHLTRERIQHRLDEVWPTLFKLLDDADSGLRAHSGAAVASMFVHGGSSTMEGAVPLLLQMCMEFDAEVQLAVAPVLPYLAEVWSPLHLMNGVLPGRHFDTLASVKESLAKTSFGSFMGIRHQATTHRTPLACDPTRRGSPWSLLLGSRG